MPQSSIASDSALIGTYLSRLWLGAKRDNSWRPTISPPPKLHSRRSSYLARSLPPAQTRAPVTCNKASFDLAAGALRRTGRSFLESVSQMKTRENWPQVNEQLTLKLDPLARMISGTL